MDAHTYTQKNDIKLKMTKSLTTFRKPMGYMAEGFTLAVFGWG